MTITPPTPPPITEELDRLLRRLRLPYMRKAAPEVIATAAAQRWEHSEVLRMLLAEEAAGRDRATIGTRRRASGLPAGKTFDAWEPAASAIPKPTQQALQTLEWVDRAEVLCVCGPSGTGKSHFIEALGHHAIDRGKSVAWHTLDTLAALLRRHRADDSIHKAISKLIRSDLILIDLCRYPHRSTMSACFPSPQTPPTRCSASSTPPTRNGRSRSAPTSTPPGSTS
jgi:DNA replication protein DnaC